MFSLFVFFVKLNNMRVYQEENKCQDQCRYCFQSTIDSSSLKSDWYLGLNADLENEHVERFNISTCLCTSSICQICFVKEIHHRIFPQDSKHDTTEFSCTVCKSTLSTVMEMNQYSHYQNFQTLVSDSHDYLDDISLQSFVQDEWLNHCLSNNQKRWESYYKDYMSQDLFSIAHLAPLQSIGKEYVLQRNLLLVYLLSLMSTTIPMNGDFGTSCLVMAVIIGFFCVVYYQHIEASLLTNQRQWTKTMKYFNQNSIETKPFSCRFYKYQECEAKVLDPLKSKSMVSYMLQNTNQIISRWNNTAANMRIYDEKHSLLHITGSNTVIRRVTLWLAGSLTFHFINDIFIKKNKDLNVFCSMLLLFLYLVFPLTTSLLTHNISVPIFYDLDDQPMNLSHETFIKIRMPLKHTNKLKQSFLVELEYRF